MIRPVFTLALGVWALASCSNKGDDRAADSTPAQPADSIAEDHTLHEAAPSDSPATVKSPVPASTTGGTPSSRSRNDTTSGTVAIEGSEPTAQVTLRTTGGKVALSGPSVVALERLSGAEVWVSGKVTSGPGRPLASRQMQVERFMVRAIDGSLVTDGTLASDGDALVLTTFAGMRHRLVSPPAALKAHAGARVWVAGNLTREPTAFGVIEPKG